MDFSRLRVVCGKTTDGGYTSFVGICRSERYSDYEFVVPNGCDNLANADYYEVKRAFFLLYRTLRIYQQQHNNKQPAKEKNTEALSGPEESSYINSEGDSVVLYAKIAEMEQIIESIDSLNVANLEKRLRRTENVDYAKLYKYYDRAVYDEDDAMVVLEMEGPLRILEYDGADIVGELCYIYCEIARELQYEPEYHVAMYSNNFREKYLTEATRIYEEDQYEETIAVLRQTLADIDRHSAYKDPDYYICYDAIEKFLYGDMSFTPEGIAWGVKNFSSIWEDLCSTFLFSDRPSNIMYADTDVCIKGKSVANRQGYYRGYYQKEGYNNPFYFIGPEGKKRWIKPDVVLNEPSRMALASGVIAVSNKKTEHKLTINDHDMLKIVQHRVQKHCKGVYVKKLSHNTIVISGLTMARLANYLPYGDTQYQYKVIDYKYVSAASYMASAFLSEKILYDIHKQLAYELCLKRSTGNGPIHSEFATPNWPEETETSVGDYVAGDALHPELLDSEIRIHKTNLPYLIQVYIDNNE